MLLPKGIDYNVNSVLKQEFMPLVSYSMSRHAAKARLRKTVTSSTAPYVQLEQRICLSIDLVNIANLNQSNLWASIREPVVSGDFVYFVGKDPGSNQLDLWRTTGTTDGVVKLASLGIDDNQPRHLIDVNGTLYFQGFDAATGRELWKTDGTVGGTTLIRDLAIGPQSWPLSKPIIYDNNLYLVGRGDVFRVNTTTNGMARLIDLAPGLSDGADNLAVSGGHLYFSAGGSLYSLYRSNGLKSGTSRVADVPDGRFRELTDVAGDLFFGRNNNELWKIDHSAMTAASIASIGFLSELTDVDGTLFFVNYSELWKSDGTGAGTVLVKETGGEAFNLFSSQGRLFFTGGSTERFSGNGVELWTSDGNAAGTMEIDINPLFNEGYGYGSYPSNFVNLNGRLYFTAYTGIWTSDGTEAGTTHVERGIVTSLTTKQGQLIFGRNADDSLLSGFWKRNPNAVKGIEVLRVGPGAAGSNPSAPVKLNGAIYFAADDGKSGRELQRIGSDGVTRLFYDINPGREGSSISNLHALNGRLFFTADSPATGMGLWSSDGTRAGTTFLKAVFVRESDQPGAFTSFENSIYFSGFTSTNGFELWRSDGTVAGTMMLNDIYPGSTYDPYERITTRNSSSPSDFVVHAGTLFFAATDGLFGRELWKTDGTQGGTVIAADLFPGIADYYPYSPSSSSPSRLMSRNGKLYFSAYTPSGAHLWESDGTSVGSTAFTDGSGVGWAFLPIFVGDQIFFLGYTNPKGYELWASDGSASGTRMVKDISPGRTWSSPLLLTAVGEQLYFVANDSVHGIELWRSNGTEEGTELVSDLNAGTASSNPTQLTVMNGTLFFSAESSTFGHELFRVPSKTAGAQLVKNLASGLNSSAPTNFAVIDNSLYFSAETRIGRELWKTSSPPPVLNIPTLTLPYIVGGSPTILAPSASFIDNDTANFRGAILNLSISSGFVVGDRLTFANVGGITTVGTSIYFNGAIIAKVFRTPSKVALHFTSSANSQSIQAAIRAVQFDINGPNTLIQRRTVRFSFIDGEGGATLDQLMHVQVRG